MKVWFHRNKNAFFFNSGKQFLLIQINNDQSLSTIASAELSKQDCVLQNKQDFDKTQKSMNNLFN